VTVVAPTATQADVLAKTTLLLGSRAGLRFVERFSSAAAIGVRSTGEMVLSAGAAEYMA
jgi:thiamine biosynthesis lipoprotein ApbE